MIYHQGEHFTLYHGDNRSILPILAENSVDAIVTDPPYELGFMGKSWDASGVAFDSATWREAMRVLKPGGHLLAFSGSRTYHRIAVAIEDAGFEIRDQIMWLYGSGFPKSLDISKAIDKGTGENKARQIQFVNWMRSTGITAKQINEATKTQMASHYIGLSQPAIATADLFDALRPYLPEVPEEIEKLVAERTGIEWTAYKNREVVGTKPSSLGGTVAAGERNQEIIDYHKNKIVDITAPATAEAKQWQGWGTALKPAHEPIVVARKPLIGTVAANVLTYGTGGLNIDGARVGNEVLPEQKAGQAQIGTFERDNMVTPERIGRWPANVIHDGSDEVVELFPQSKAPKPYEKSKAGWLTPGSTHEVNDLQSVEYGDSGSAARFFYCAKTSKRDRNEGLEDFEAQRRAGLKGSDRDGDINPVSERWRTQPSQNHHPTVKPTDLMRYLCRLVTPKGGIVLDPFTGSGSTGKAAIYEGFNFIGIEMTDEYLPIAKARIEFATNDREETLFDA